MHIRQPVTVEKTPDKVPKLVHYVLHFREKKKQNKTVFRIFLILKLSLAWEKRRLRDSTKA